MTLFHKCNKSVIKTAFVDCFGYKFGKFLFFKDFACRIGIFIITWSRKICVGVNYPCTSF